MTRMCERCARKLEPHYDVTEEGGAVFGICPLCSCQTRTMIWEITPKRTRYVRRSGGGERDRAGRRAG